MITTVDIKTGKVTQREMTPEEQAALPVPTPEELEQQAREAFKAQRQILVDNIKVTVGDKTFDGDEVSQTRMARAITVLLEGETVLWVLADNTSTQCTKAELIEALRLAGEEQTRLWVMP